jgi:hypothetical protein
LITGVIRANRSDTPNQVADDVVAVEAHPRDELLEHQDLLADDHDQEGLVSRGQKGSGHSERKQRVEVHTTEVDAQATRLGQAVGVGDVGVEDRPYQVDADSDAARSRSAVAARGGVPALVKGQRQNRHVEQREQYAAPAEPPRSRRCRRGRARP